MKKNIIGFTLFASSFIFYLCQTAPSVTAGDSGEFITAAGSLSLAHAPSYPLYTVLSRSFLVCVPFGSIPYRCNVLSSLCAAVALFLFFHLAMRIQTSLGIAVLSSIVLGLTTSFWENALMTEVFALNTSWLILLLLLLSFLYEKIEMKWLGLFFFLWGLGLGNHHVLIFIAPAFVCVCWPGYLFRSRPQLLFWGFIFFAIGFSIYLFLPIRSQQQPPLNWGQPTTVNRFMRTLTRKDYGTLKLATGDQPERTFALVKDQLTLYLRLINKEMPWPFLVVGLLGLLLNFKNKFVLGTFLIFIFAGPLFFLQSNLPMNAQTEGIMGRFFIMPMVMLILGGVFFTTFLVNSFPKSSMILKSGLVFLTVILFLNGRSEAWGYRYQMLVWDYGQAMLKNIPRGGALFMDGGDDAFYSTAMLQFVMKQRPDLMLHDRGGLVFKNPYGDDFRQLSPDDKKARRAFTENLVYETRPLFYCSMDPHVFPNHTVNPNGLLLEAPHPQRASIEMNWDLIVLRSLYPLDVHHFRNRGLAAFFPYMKGKSLFNQGQMIESFKFFSRAQQLGGDVEWLAHNLAYDYSLWSFQALSDGQYDKAETIYNQWLTLDPQAEGAISNLGVVYERQGNLDKAQQQYLKAAHLFPQAADPVFNLAVMSWKKQEWLQVIAFLEETLKRNPHHPTAAQFLAQAKLRMKLP